MTVWPRGVYHGCIISSSCLIFTVRPRGVCRFLPYGQGGFVAHFFTEKYQKNIHENRFLHVPHRCVFGLSISGFRGPLRDSWEVLGSRLQVMCSFSQLILGLKGPLGDFWGALGSSCRVLCGFLSVTISGLRGPLGDSWGRLGSSCRILCIRFVFQVRASGCPRGIPGDSWAPAVVHCVLFVCQFWILGGPLGDSWGFLCSGCQVLCVFFVCVSFRPQGTLGRFLGTPNCVFFRLSILGVRGSLRLLGTPRLQLSGVVCFFVVFKFRTSGGPGSHGDSRAPAVGYCVFSLFFNFGPWGTPGETPGGFCAPAVAVVTVARPTRLPSTSSKL